MNKPLLKEAAEIILKRPKQFRMEGFFGSVDSKYNRPSHCGTAACIAGWGITLAQTKTKKPIDGQIALAHATEDAHLLGKRAFKLTEGQANRLFYLDEWPIKFLSGYHDAPTAKEAAKAAYDRIHHFIRTGK